MALESGARQLCRREKTMEHVGIDLAKNKSQVCILTADGEVIERRIATTREQFTKVLGDRPPSRVLVESSTESEWVARHVESLGHEVIVADPNFAPMYAKRTRRIKTDRRDAAELAQACHIGNYRAAHRLSEKQRDSRARIGVREALVRTRAKYVTLVQTLLRRDGLRVGTGTTRGFLTRLKAVGMSARLQAQVQPLLTLLDHINTAIAEADAWLAEQAKSDPVLRRLSSVPGVGPVTAASFAAAVDDVGRFGQAKHVAAYLGLVPSESSSGDRQSRGGITKAGNGRARWLLVEAAWAILRYKKPETEQLREWASRIAGRRGKRVAAVALARKLARILFAMWRDGRDYAPILPALQPSVAALT